MDKGANRDFAGAKLALFLGEDLVVIRRDDRPDILWPGALDLAGGGREDDETPVECVLRETHEELGLTLTEDDLVWRRFYPDADVRAWYFVGRIDATRVDDIRFGTEGQGWGLMTAEEFLARDDAVPHFQQRLRVYLAQRC